MNRPILDKNLDSQLFTEFYYLKEELIQFCRDYNLPTSGGKIELTNRIQQYLKDGSVLKINKKQRAVEVDQTFSLATVILPHMRYSEKHRAFFKQYLGPTFSFNVPFQRWLKENSGKTFQDAIDAYPILLDIKKKQGAAIDKQFEYNTYIRDFFQDNKGKSLEDAIKCWRYKKSLQGHNKYEKSDCNVLK